MNMPIDGLESLVHTFIITQYPQSYPNPNHKDPPPPPPAPPPPSDPEMDAEMDEAECRSVTPEADSGGAGVGGASGAVLWLYSVTCRSTPLWKRSEAILPASGAKGEWRWLT